MFYYLFLDCYAGESLGKTTLINIGYNFKILIILCLSWKSFF